MILLLIFAPISLILTLIFTALIGWYYQYFKYERYLSKFSGPKPYPIVGNALEFLSTSAILPNLVKYAKEKRTFRIYLAYEPNLIISEPKLVQKLLSSQKITAKSVTYDFLKSWLGNGLLTSDTGPTWKKSRRILTSGFYSKSLEVYVNVFNSAGNELTTMLAHKAKDNTGFDISGYLIMYALDVIGESAMGVKMNAMKTSSEYANGVHELTRIIVHRTFNPFGRFAWIYRLSKDYQNEKKALKIVHSYADAIIKKRKQDLLSDPENINMAKPKCLLDILLKESADNGLLSDKQMREEVETIMFAGHDTTAWTINFIIYSLSNNQDVQENVYKEVKMILRDNGNITYQNLQDMKYLELVIKETMRYYSTIPLYGRLVTENIEFEGKIIPKGTTIIINPFWMHRDPKFYPDPEKFIPERFLPEQRKGKNPFQYVPFSAGHRNCIGQQFAMLEMKATIAKLILSFKILPATPRHELRLVTEAVLKSENGIVVRLCQRTLN